MAVNHRATRGRRTLIMASRAAWRAIQRVEHAHMAPGQSARAVLEVARYVVVDRGRKHAGYAVLFLLLGVALTLVAFVFGWLGLAADGAVMWTGPCVAFALSIAHTYVRLTLRDVAGALTPPDDESQ